MIVGKGDGVDIAHNDAELLCQLTTKRFNGPLPRLDFASWELPETSARLPLRSLCDPYLAALAQCARHKQCRGATAMRA